MTALTISRRYLLKTTVFGVAGASLNLGSLSRAFAAKDLTVGVVYVGARDDFGWNQAHAVAIKSLAEVPGVKVVEEENVPETDAVSKSMESMINLDGAGLILATSFGYYSPFVIDLAKKYPDVEFRHAAPLWNKDKDPKNAGSYFGYLNQAHYVNGVAAGLSTKSNKIGFRGCEADSDRAEQHQFGLARGALGQSERHRASDLHRRLVVARPRSRSGERSRRCWLRRHHLPC
jgi:basic membrane protein A and related proteins